MTQHALPESRRGPGWPFLVILAIGLIVAFVAIFAAGPFSGSSNDRDGRYVEAVIGSPARINPLFAHLNDTDRDLTALVFSGLTRLGPDGEPLPDLAESWQVSANGADVTFSLRRDVVWHDGALFTADDVIFTYELLASGDVQSDPEQSLLWRQVECSAPDAFTVTCRLPQPFSPFLSYATIGILPRHVLEGVEPASLFDHAFNRSPVGTGPYRLTQLSQSQAILRANARYHLGAPRVPEIQMRFYPDSATAAADVVRGEADGILLDLTVSAGDFNSITSLPGFRPYSANRSAYTALFLNNGDPPLNEQAVRTAIAHAIDIDSIIGKILGGRAVRANTALIPGSWAYNPDIEPPSRDRGEARRLLDEAGWALPEGSEIRQRNGIDLHFSLLTDEDPIRSAVAEQIAEDLQDVGIGVTVLRERSTNLVRDFLIPREYEAAIFGWDPGPDPDPYPAWHSSQATGNGRNLAAYSSEDADRLMEEARREYDMERRKRLYDTYQIVFEEDVPSVLLYYPVYTYLVTSEITNVQVGVLFQRSSRFLNVHEWAFERGADISG
jgi:peptide/nickel transport system substrate-binding protein